MSCGARARWLARALGLCAPASVLADTVGPLSSPTSIFDPASTPAQSIFGLSLLVLTTLAAIFIVVFGLLAYAVLKFRVAAPLFLPGAPAITMLNGLPRPFVREAFRAAPAEAAGSASRGHLHATCILLVRGQCCRDRLACPRCV